MKSMSMNALSALEEIERSILQLIDDSVPNHAVKLLALQNEVYQIKTNLRKFNDANEEFCIEKINSEFEELCLKHNITVTEQIKNIFIESHIEKNKYIKELEGCLSGDPNLVADEASKCHWRHTAILYAEKLEKKIRELEAKSL